MGKLLLVSDDHLFVWFFSGMSLRSASYASNGFMGMAQLEQQKRIQPLSGFGFAGVAVKATRKQLLALLLKGLRNRRITFPDQNKPIAWPQIYLAKRTA